MEIDFLDTNHRNHENSKNLTSRPKRKGQGGLYFKARLG